MTMINTSKPSGSMVNTRNRVVSYETWDSNTTTWDTETRTWNEMAATMSNTSRPISSIVNTSKP